MPLTMAQCGEALAIKQITGKDEARRFLSDLGFVAGAVVTVISKLEGNLILGVKDTRIALSSQMASRILV